MQIENFLFSVSDALRWPVLVLVLVALFWSVVEIGILLAEVWRRRWRSINSLENAVEQAEVYIVQGDQIGAITALSSVSWSSPMREVMTSIVTLRPGPDAESAAPQPVANGAIKALGAARWKALHRLVYAIVLLGLLHFFWMRSAKNNFGEVAVYAAIVAVLLGWRLWRRFAAARTPRLSPS